MPPSAPTASPGPDAAWARRSTLGMGVGALASKALGLVREVLLARFFGTGPVTDGYRASLTLALSPVHLLTTHAIQTCFIPLYTRLRGQDRRRADGLFQGVLLLFLGAGLALAAVLFGGAGWLSRTLLPGFDAERQQLTAAMLRIMALGVPPYIYCTLLSSLGAAQRDYRLPTIRPGVQNLGLLVMILAAVAAGRPVLAAYGFTLTYWLLAAVATGMLAARRELPSGWHLPRADLAPLWRSFWVPLRPLLLLSLMIQANLVIERLLSSLVGGGTVAAMDYARFITETTHALMLMPLGLVSLTRFAELPPERLRETTDRVLSLIFLLLVPISVFLTVSGGPLIGLLYERGAFDSLSHETTRRALLGLGAGLWAVGGAYFLRNVLHARMENGRVLRAEALAVALNVAFVLLTYRRLGILALGLGPSIGALGALAVYYGRLGYGGARAPRRLLLLLAGAVPCAAVSWWLRGVAASAWAAFAVQLGWAGLFWAGWVIAVPSLRAAAGELVRRRRAGRQRPAGPGNRGTR